MKINVNKTILGSLLGLCFLMSYDRVHEFYVSHVPLGKVGSCYDIKYPNFKPHYQMEIVDNNNKTDNSVVLISRLEPNAEQWAQEFTYFELRLLSPKKMRCL